MDKEPKNLIAKLLDASVMFVVAALLLRLGVCFLLDIWPVLVIIVTLIVISIIIYRIWKSRNNAKW